MNSIANSGFFMMLTNLNKKIPHWVKLFFKLLFLFIVIVKLLGFKSIFDVFFNLYYFKMYGYISCSLVIIYQLLNLYFLHKFNNKSFKISDILPEFLISWLKEFEEICNSREAIKEFKNMCYIQIGIYLTIIIFIAFIF